MHILETKSCPQGRRKHSKFLQADWRDKEKQRIVLSPKEAEKKVCAEIKNRWNKQKTAGRFKPTISIITLNVSDLNQGWAKYSPQAKSSHACFEYQWCRFYPGLPGLTHCDRHSLGCKYESMYDTAFCRKVYLFLF